MDEKKFQRTKEDFTCDVCGTNVTGTGYTNHCPKCLWSKHVDIHPGDRASNCGGLMEPVEVRKESDTYTIKHKCTICGHEKNNKTSPNDVFDLLIQISSKQAQ